MPTWELAGAWRTLLGATGAAKDQAGRQLWLLPTRPWQNGWKPPSFGPFSHCGARSRFAMVGLSHEGTDPCSCPGGSRAGSGSPRRPDKLIPANRECICSCGACRKWDKRNGLHLLSFASPSAPDQTQPCKVLSVVTLQTRKPQDSLTLTSRACATHTSPKGSSKSAEVLPCERTSAKFNPSLVCPNRWTGKPQRVRLAWASSARKGTQTLPCALSQCRGAVLLRSSPGGNLLLYKSC